MTAMVQKIIEEVKVLSVAERRELEAALAESVPAAPETARERAVVQQLAERGVITPARRPLLAVRPASITGQPVSEIIVAERR